MARVRESEYEYFTDTRYEGFEYDLILLRPEGRALGKLLSPGKPSS
jgi:hypothetical protein